MNELLKLKTKISKETHDIKLAESLSPITKRIDEVKETTQKLGKVIENLTPENNTPQLAIGKSPTNQPFEKNEVVIYDVDLENTLQKDR